MVAVRAVSDDKTVLLVTHDAAEAEFFGGKPGFLSLDSTPFPR